MTRRDHWSTLDSAGGRIGPRSRGWRWWTRAAGLILRGTTLQVALPIALVVGTVLVGVNMGAELAAGEADEATALRILANYAIPYLVSSIGYLSASTRDETGLPDAQRSAGGGEPQ
jgi:hypothetical protein